MPLVQVKISEYRANAEDNSGSGHQAIKESLEIILVHYNRVKGLVGYSREIAFWQKEEIPFDCSWLEVPVH